ncbi:hypothetical protein BGZ51_007193 [Haplosporangium sp. Z 767]|nr:hypothetical protein BGZ51_007193 [Haplosporangium sp. Z 767]KAF9179596.1 hypothetical protein BGZ50_006796 [Haplosporangium sp. Z 11]
MKPTACNAAIALDALVLLSIASAVLSPGYKNHLKRLESPSFPQASCRVYETLGYPRSTHANDHDTVRLRKALTAYHATPSCTMEQYLVIYKDLQTSSHWEAVCLKYTISGISSIRKTDSISKMNVPTHLPDANPSEGDLYGYLQYVTLMANPTEIDARTFCIACNQHVASVSLYYYLNHPATFVLNFAQHLTNETLSIGLVEQYQQNCRAPSGKPNAKSGSISSSNGKDSSSIDGGSGVKGMTTTTATLDNFQPTNLTELEGILPGFGNNALSTSGIVFSIRDAAVALAIVAGVMTTL